ncbi:hypothetical protein FNH22_29345 [Fulvivirga sp. M361]|uniref:hypothetical protein n=1 Tax=Fulvivirga sp. M361 TaxID=2594266 RepID=UPI001179D8D2|nr:hypothetical protein [Fulvivirga sp. M361]TRX48281.1 hypothetical protein FNH22_29345 [Fulvivirga sp. M361]
MDTQNKSEFEQEWENAFEGAEIQPSKAVWDRVALALANSANGSFRKKIIVFKLLAAASVAFAMTIGGIGLYNGYFEDASLLTPGEKLSKNQLDDRTPAEVSSQAPETTEKAQPNISFESNTANQLAAATNSEMKEGSELISSEGPVPANMVDAIHANDGSNPPLIAETQTSTRTAERVSTDTKQVLSDVESKNVYSTAISEEKSNSSYASLEELVEDPRHLQDADKMGRDPNVGSLEQVPEKLEKLMAQLETASLRERELTMVPWYVFNQTNDRKTSKNKAWAGLGMGGGEFNFSGASPLPTTANAAILSPNVEDLFGYDYNEASNQFTLLNNEQSRRSEQPDIGEEQSGTSFNIGFNVGVRVAQRWIIQSGASFIERNTTNTSNVVLQDGTGNSNPLVISDADVLNSSENVLVVPEYDVENKYQLISVPLQVGYVVLDRKLAITLLGGFSNDVLLSRKASTEFAEFQDYSGRGGYRKYNVAGLLSTEIGYKLGSNYQVSLMPQIRKSVHSIRTTRDDEKPTFMEMGFRFKYIID